MRLFAAFLLDESVRAELARVSGRLAKACNGVRWIPADQLHVTVKFLGDVPDRDVAHVIRAMESGAARASAFAMEFHVCGCFPPRGPVRIVWAGGPEPSTEMAQAANEICGSLEALGFASESRAWSPHVTLGRVKSDSSNGRIRAIADAYRFDPLRQQVTRVSMMQSTLSPRGPTYVPVGHALLGE